MNPGKIMAAWTMFSQALSVGFEASFQLRNRIDPFKIPPINPATAVPFRNLEKP